MAVDTNTRGFISLIPFTLPLSLVLPYAFVASRFRGLVWVWDVGYKPFWFTFGTLLVLAVVSSFLLWRLQEIGSTLYQVGIALATIQSTYMAMSERRDSLLLLIFLLFAAQVLLSEKVKKVLRLPFFASRRKWWESYPKGIPGLKVELAGAEGETMEGRLSNFGEAGCFVFAESGAVAFVPRFVRVMSRESTLLEAEVEPVLKTRDGFGWGLRFSRAAMDGDWSKDLQDYLGYLRRAGYEVA
jgi:hypothetical protein